MSGEATHHVSEWIAKLRSGDADERAMAQQKIYDTYCEQLCNRAHHKMTNRALREQPSRAVVNAVLKSFFSDHPSSINNRNSLAAYLFRAVINRAASANRSTFAAKRGFAKQVSIDDVNKNEIPKPYGEADKKPLKRSYRRNHSNGDDEVISPAFFTDEVIECLKLGATEEHLDFLNDYVCRLPNDLQEITIMKLENRSDSEIARHLGMSVDGVQAAIDSIQEMWSPDFPELQ